MKQLKWVNKAKLDLIN